MISRPAVLGNQEIGQKFNPCRFPRHGEIEAVTNRDVLARASPQNTSSVINTSTFGADSSTSESRSHSGFRTSLALKIKWDQRLVQLYNLDLLQIHRRLISGAQQERYKRYQDSDRDCCKESAEGGGIFSIANSMPYIGEQTSLQSRCHSPYAPFRLRQPAQSSLTRHRMERT
jgi:hypothetical protein